MFSSLPSPGAPVKVVLCTTPQLINHNERSAPDLSSNFRKKCSFDFEHGLDGCTHTALMAVLTKNQAPLRLAPAILYGAKYIVYMINNAPGVINNPSVSKKVGVTALICVFSSNNANNYELPNGEFFVCPWGTHVLYVH